MSVGNFADAHTSLKQRSLEGLGSPVFVRIAASLAAAVAIALCLPIVAHAQTSAQVPAVAGQPAETGASIVALGFTPCSVAASDDGKWIAMLDPKAGVAYLWKGAADLSLAAARKVPVGSGGGFVGFKHHANRQWLVVGTTGDLTIRAIDPETLAVTREAARVGLFQSGFTPVPDPASPLVYFLPGSPGENTDGVAAFDVSTGKVTAYPSTDYSLSAPLDFTSSFDGRMLYVRRLRVIPSGHRAIEVIPPAPGQTTGSLRVIFHEHTIMGRYFVDPATGTVLAGKDAYAPDLLTKVGQTEHGGRTLAFAPDRATVLKQEGALLRAISTNTWRQQASAWHPLIKKEQRPKQRPQDWPMKDGPDAPNAIPTVFVRQGTRWVALMVSDAEAALIDLDSWGVPNEPVLAAKAPRIASATVGQPLVIDLSPVNPSVRVELEQTPVGGLLTGNTLTWTPGDSDVGRTVLTLRLSTGTLSRSQTLTVEVRQPALALPFAPTKWTLSPDGKTLAVLGGRGRSLSGLPVQSVELATADLAKGTVGPMRILDSALNDLGTDGTRVFILPQVQSLLAALKADDLTELASSPLPQPGQTLIVTGQDEVVVNYRDSQSLAFDLKTLVPREQPAKLSYRYGRHLNLGRDPDTAWSPLGSGLVLTRGRVIDQRASTPKPLLITQALDVGNPFPNSSWGRSPAHSAGQEPLARLPSPWGIYLKDGGELLRADGSTLTNLRSSGSSHEGPTVLGTALLAGVPAAVALHQTQIVPRRSGALARTRLELVSYDLITGKAVSSLTLADEPRSSGLSDEAWPYTRFHRIMETDNGLVVIAGDRVYSLPFSKLPLSKLAEPFRFTLAQDRVDLPTDRITKLSVPSRSGSGKPRYELVCHAKSVTIDSATGQVTVDGPKLAAEFITELSKAASRNAAGSHVPDEAVLEPIRARVATLTGVRTKGVPVLLTFRVTARDEKQAVAAIEHTYVVDLSRATFDEHMATLEAEKKKAAAAAAAARPAPDSTAAPSGSNAALLQRIAELERRNAELEGQVKLLREMLARPAPQPSTTP